MKRWMMLLVVFTVLLGAVPAAQAQSRFGFGFILGEPTGLSFKYRMNRDNAVDGAIGFSPWDRARIHVDYLWHARPVRDPLSGPGKTAAPARGMNQSKTRARWWRGRPRFPARPPSRGKSR